MAEFKLIVAGSRGFSDYQKLKRDIDALAFGPYSNDEISIVSGGARGADALGERFARVNGVQLYRFPADWDRYGKRAGFFRNERMASFADGLLAFWDGVSPGTQHMIAYMTSLKKPVYVRKFRARTEQA